MNSDDLKKIRAKSDGTTLVEHTYAVMRMGLILVQSLPLTASEKKTLAQKIQIAAILHDLGKIHPRFQQSLDGALTSIRHELISLWFCITFLDLDQDILFAIATHHKNVVQSESPKAFELNQFSNVQNLYEEFCHEMTQETLLSWLDLFRLSLPWKNNPKVTGTLNRDIINILRKQKQATLTSLAERQSFSFLRAILQAADHIASAGIENIPTYQPIKIEDFQPVKDNIAYPFRHFQEVLQTWKGDVLLHAPTGSGKTEAAFNWIYANQTENNRLIYLLPYTASINAMIIRLQKVYNPRSVTVQHSKSLNYIYDELVNEDSNRIKNYRQIEKNARNVNSLTKEIYYPVKVATLHQILRMPLCGKGWEFSFVDYKNALFIIDEFHAYNALLTGMMLETVKLFKRLLNAKFLFMSATIPQFLLNKIIEEIYDGDYRKLLRPDAKYPSDAIILNRKRHHLICKKGKSIFSAIPEIEQHLLDKKSVLVIVNNIKTCQNIFSKIDIDESKKMMLHGGFNLVSRKEIESRITHKDPAMRPQLLVATQAVEVSLDIDYHVAFIENAPIDALIQRFGRVNRAGKLCNNRGEPIMAPIYLYEDIEGKTPFYPEQLLIDTWNNLLVLDQKDLSENDLINACDKVYQSGYSETQKKDFNQGRTAVKLLEEQWIAADCKDWIEEIFEINNQKIDVLCYNLLDQYMELIELKRYIEANQLFVSVYPHIEHKIICIGNNKIFITYALEYDNKTGTKTKDPSSAVYL